MNQPTLKAFESLWNRLGAKGDPVATFQRLVNY